MTIAGRVEARMTIPSGGANFAACNGAQSAVQTLTLPAGNYFHTAAGGVSGLLATLQSYLNDNVQGYPQAASAMQAAVKYGTWSSAWNFNETSGNAIAAFGAINLTPNSSPTYGTAGPRGGIDKAVGMDSVDDSFNGGNNFNVNATDDLVFAWVGKHSATGNGDMIGKWSGAPGWLLIAETTRYRFFSQLGGTSAFADTAGMITGEWVAGLAYIDRGAGKIGIAVKGLTSGTTLTASANFALGDLTNAIAFRVGDQDNYGASANSGLFAYVAIGSGTSVASGMHANIATAIANWADAINSQWSVSFDATTGRATISNSFWPSSLAFTNTSLRDVLGFEYDVDYPSTATQTQTAIGGLGTWLYGWQFNEAASPLVASYGSRNLQLSFGAPSFSHQGARGGSDKAISHTDGAASIFSAVTSPTSFLDVTGTQDIAFLWVGKFDAAPATTRTVFNKWDTAGGGKGYHLRCDPTTGFTFVTRTSGNTADTGSAGLFIGEYHVGLAVMERATGKIRVGSRGLTSNTTVVTAEAALTANDETNGFSWQLGSGAGLGATPMRISALYVAHGAGACTGMSANMSTILSTFAAYMKGQTSTKHARGLWIPDSSFTLAGADPRMAPKVTDRRSSEGPTGVQLSLMGNYKRQHQTLTWSHVTLDRVREASATYANGSWERFLDETQFGAGSSWFSVDSQIQIYDHNGYRLGQDANIPGWWMKKVRSFEDTASLSIETFSGLWNIRIPALGAEGA